VLAFVATTEDAALAAVDGGRPFGTGALKASGSRPP
jgi:hypothetical protein